MEILKAQKLPKNQGFHVKITKSFTITSEKKLGIFLNDNGFKIKPQFSVLNDDRFFLLHAEKEDNNEWSE